MKGKPKKSANISRRSVLSLLGSGMVLPFIVAGDEENEQYNPPQAEEFQTFLKQDGTLVKIKPQAVKKSKVIRKKISNRRLLNWLKLGNSETNSNKI